MAISRPSERAVLVRIAGLDIGELGQRPFLVLTELIGRGGPCDLFIDASQARGPSVDVSAQWAGWLHGNRERFQHIHMLTRSRFVQLTASFVQRFAELGERMRIFTDRAAFEAALAL